ncbi:hypothetical protein SLA2020_507940 [Shorea laevis]
MPPKQPSKAELAKKQKIVEDKTFGLKNKMSIKPNFGIKILEIYLVVSYAVHLRVKISVFIAKQKCILSLACLMNSHELIHGFCIQQIVVSQPKVPVGVDPKSMVCEFYKVGQCQKGFTCKFSRDLNVQRKGEKINLYSDKRDEGSCMNIVFYLIVILAVIWLVFLKFVLLSIYGLSFFKKQWRTGIKRLWRRLWSQKKKEYNRNKSTDIACKYFLEAVEKKQYGWFWVCPNGGKDCHYRHALPPGYVSKSQMKALIEKMPAAQKAERTKNDRMSGCELFMSDASLFVDDAGLMRNTKERKNLMLRNRRFNNNSAANEQSTSATSGGDAEALPEDYHDDNDELDIGELNEPAASLAKTSIQIQEPNNDV